MRKQLFITTLFFVIIHFCAGQVLSLQVNAAGGKYFYLTRDIYDQFHHVTYSGGWTGALETNLIVNKLGFSWLGLNIGIGLKNCYRHQTITHYNRIPRTNLTAYALSEGDFIWNFLDLRFFPEIKMLKKHDFYIFAGYYQARLYHHKVKSMSKTQYDTFPTSVEGGHYAEQILKRKDLKEGSYQNTIQGFSVGIRYAWRNFTFQIRDDYAKSSGNPPISYSPPILFNNHTLCIGLGYEFDFFDKK